jgi:hypothetical protein
MPEMTIDNRIAAKTILNAIAKGELGNARYWQVDGHEVHSILVTNPSGQPILKIARTQETDTHYLVFMKRTPPTSGAIPMKDLLRVAQSAEQIEKLIRDRLPQKKPRSLNTAHCRDGFRTYTYKHLLKVIDDGAFPKELEWHKHPELGASILVKMPNASNDLVIVPHHKDRNTYDIFPAGKIDGATFSRNAQQVEAMAKAVGNEYRYQGRLEDDAGFEPTHLRQTLIRLRHNIKPQRLDVQAMLRELEQPQERQR